MSLRPRLAVAYQEHIVAEGGEIGAHLLFNCVPIGTNALPIGQLGRVECLRTLDCAQIAEPRFIHADEMDDLARSEPCE